MGGLIANVMEKTGKDGVITVDEGKGLEYETDYVEGMQRSGFVISNPNIPSGGGGCGSGGACACGSGGGGC